MMLSPEGGKIAASNASALV